MAEAVRAWVPIVISICAISMTIFQAMATRRHMRLSVQPRVDWRIEEDAGAGTVILSLANVGFGPAVVSDLAFVIDGEAVRATGPEACAEVDGRIGRGDAERWDTACFSNIGEYVLRPGDTVVIYGNRPAPAHADEDHAASRVDFRRFGATARYCSFYEECWSLEAS